MTLVKTKIGDNPDGSPKFFYDFANDPDFDPQTHAILHTGPISGTIVLADGTAYDVTEACIAVRSEHLLELEDAIHRSHHAAGRFLDCPLPVRD